MSFIYDIDEEKDSREDQKLPNLEHDICRAKMFLQQHSPESGDSLYNHLSELLEKILCERPRNAIDLFEDYSKKLKDERYKSKTDYLQEHYVQPVPCEEAKHFIRLYQDLKNENNAEDAIEDEDKNDDSRRNSPDLLELFFHFEQIDVGLPRCEIVALNFSIRKLIADKPIKNVRFWGKIVGKPKNYYIIEAEFLDEELIARRSRVEENAEKTEEDENSNEIKPGDKNEEIMEEEKITTQITSDNGTSDELKLEFPPMPKILWKESPIVPVEQIGIGVNKNVYYVCNSPGIDEWTELPSLTPQQIVSARQFVRVFTGDLETPINTFPPFLGTEKNYLRAQIARISAATLVSPIGFFTFGEGVDEEDEEEADTEIADEEETTGSGMISENHHYEPLSLKELIDPSLSNWCHHGPYILRQGRTTWWDPRKAETRENENETDAEEEEDAEDEEEEEDEDDKGDDNSGDFQKEVGPPLLTPLSEDTPLGSIAAWTARASSTIKSDRTTIATVRSNVWPGSFAFAIGKTFANLYIGMGQKFNPYNYGPPDMPMIQEQYNIGPEVMEIQDPSFEAEEAYRIAHLPPSEPGPLELGKEDEDEDDDYEDDDEDDD